MALYHAFTNNVVDVTGTLTVWNGTTTASVAATDIVRPRDWNSQHIQQVTLSGNVAGNSTLSGTNIIYQGGNNVTLSGTGSTIIFSAAGGGGAGDGGNVLAAGTQTANTTGTVVFSNSNNVTFGMNNSSVVTASASFPAQSVQTQNLVSIQGSTGNISFNNGNGITFGGNASTITASHNGLTSQSNQAASASNGSFTFQTLNFSNANNVTFGSSAGGIMTASVNAQSVQTQNLHNVTLSGNTAGVMAQISSGTLSLAGGNNITLSQNGNAVTISGVNTVAQTVQTQNLVSILGSTGNISFANGNNVTFGGNASTVTASASFNQTAQTVGGYAVGNTTGASSSSTVDARSFSIQGAGAASVGFSNGLWIVSAPNAAAGNVTFSAGTASNGLANIVFSNSNGVSFGLNGSTITASAAGGGAADGVNILAAGTQTANTTGTVLFQNSNGVTFGMSNSSVITASYSQPTLSSYFYPEAGDLTVISAPVNGSISVQRFHAFDQITATSFGIMASMSPLTSADNRTFSFVYSHWVGIYTNNAGTLSSLSSASLATTLGTYSSNATNSANSARILTLPFNVFMTPNIYYIMNVLSTNCISTSTSSQTVAAMNMTLYGINMATNNNFEILGNGTNATINRFYSGQGVFGTTTNAVPASINLTGLQQTGTNVARANLGFAMRA